MDAADVGARLIRTIRVRAGLSQAELARRAGIPRSVLNAYEHRRRQPGADALARIVEAAGYRLGVVPAPRRPDPERAGYLLEQVLDLAEALPSRKARELPYPPFRELVA
jgi:transcriptional regulator with XRE-family HTH domain